MTYCQPVAARASVWLNRDPIGEAGGLNLYVLVGNSPLARTDALGLDGGSPAPPASPPPTDTTGMGLQEYCDELRDEIHAMMLGMTHFTGGGLAINEAMELGRLISLYEALGCADDDPPCPSLVPPISPPVPEPWETPLPRGPAWWEYVLAVPVKLLDRISIIFIPPPDFLFPGIDDGPRIDSIK